MPAETVSTIDPTLVPIIGYGLTFVASIVTGVIVGIHLQKRKETHEVKLKEMDIQQKRDEMMYSELKDFKAKKQAAGELIISHMALDIQQIQVRKQMYETLLNTPPSDFSRKQNAMFREQLDSISARWAKQADDDALGLYYAYFANPETDGNPEHGSDEDVAIRSATERSFDQDEELQHNLHELSTEIETLAEQYMTDLGRLGYDADEAAFTRHYNLKEELLLMHEHRQQYLIDLLQVLDTRLAQYRANLFAIRQQITVREGK